MGIGKQAVKLGIKGVKEATPAIQKYVTETFGEAKQNLFSSMAKNNHPKYPEITQDLDTLTKSTDESVRETLGYNVHQKLDGVFADGERLNTASKVTSIPQSSVKSMNTFEIGKISDTFAPFLNKQKPKLTDKIADKKAGASYLQEAKEYWAKNKTFKGFKRFTDPETGQPTHKIRDNSKFLKDGTRSAKVRKLSNREIEDTKRLRAEKEQSLGAATDKTRVHHRFELSFLDRIANGLKPKEKKEFFELINNSDRWPNLKTGNQDLNMIGTKGDKRFKPIHTDIHKLLARAGLDPDTVDFTGATMQQRLDFLDEVAPLLDQVDKFIFNQMMSAKFPDQFTAFEI